MAQSDDEEWLAAVDRVATAAGVIMERHHLDTDHAYAWLMDESVRTGRVVADVIENVIREAMDGS